MQLVTQIEVAINHQYTAFALLYKVTDREGRLHRCQNFQLDFYEKLTEQLEGLITTSGEQFRLVPIDRAIGFLEKQKSYSMFLNRAVKKVDITNLMNSLSVTWRAEQNGELSV